jgi:hypothetical protein
MEKFNTLIYMIFDTIGHTASSTKSGCAVQDRRRIEDGAWVAPNRCNRRMDGRCTAP